MSNIRNAIIIAISRILLAGMVSAFVYPVSEQKKPDNSEFDNGTKTFRF